MKFLSYTLNQLTPTYGNKNQFEIIKKSDISKGDTANDSFINTTVHIGTHIDMPYHFYEDGQTLLDFEDNFWVFKKPCIIEVKPINIIIKDELLEQLENIRNKDYDILIVKTGMCKLREKDEFWQQNVGFHPEVYDYLVQNFPKLRVLGFDSISVSSFTNRVLGREAHKRFLNPKRPILLLEDMKLLDIDQSTSFKQIIVAPLRIEQCDGLPCTVLGLLDS
jgi:kynurenine formamidase